MDETIALILCFLNGFIVGALVMRVGLLHIAKKYQEHCEREENQ